MKTGKTKREKYLKAKRNARVCRYKSERYQK